MIKYSVETQVLEDDFGPFVKVEEAREDIEWLVSLIRDKEIEGTEEEYEQFDDICERWDV